MNNTNRPRCIDCNVQLNSRNASIDGSATDRMCDICYDYAGHEASHQDGYHNEDEQGAEANCLMCFPDSRKDRSRKSNVVKPHTSRSHDACYVAGTHEKSPKGRAACRLAGGPHA